MRARSLALAVLAVALCSCAAWTTGRYDGLVYVVDTTSGKLLHTIRVGGQHHGLTYIRNAGRFGLGHNGVYR